MIAYSLCCDSSKYTSQITSRKNKSQNPQENLLIVNTSQNAYSSSKVDIPDFKFIEIKNAINIRLY